MSYRTHRSVWYRYWHCTEIIEVSGTGFDVVPKWSKCPVPASMSYRTYLSVRYRYWCRTEVTDVSGTGIGFVPKVPKCPVPVMMSYRSYLSVRHRYWCRTEVAEVSGTGIDIVPNVPKRPVPVLMSYRSYRSFWYRYESLYRYRRYRYPCRTEITEVSGTGIEVAPKWPKCPVTVWKPVPVPAVPVSMSYRSCRRFRHRYWCRTEVTEVELMPYRSDRRVR